jgi:hypothetical protein
MSFGLLVSGQWGVRPVAELLQETDAAKREAETVCGRRSRGLQWQNWLREFMSPSSGLVDHPIFAFGVPCDIMLRIAALEPGARFSRHASRRLQVSSMFENK